MLEFLIDASAPATRELAVTLRLDLPVDAPHLELFLPTWTPGSYLLREYARHLSRVEARSTDSGEPLVCRKASKNRFVVDAPAGSRVEVRYRVYAHELSVRTADLDGSHAYWNHACVLLWPVDRRDVAAEICVVHRAESTIACSLPIVAERICDDTRETTLRANDLDEALDAPVLVGDLQRIDWQVDGVEHSIVLEGLGGVRPPNSLADDLAAIVRKAADVFGGALPYRHYTFLALFSDQAHGGLEHRESSSLLMSRTALTSEKGYRDFLGLAAHELFHAWNVKRMRPVEFWTYDYEQENYTTLLWLMEGWTAYYDDLLVARAGRMSHSNYLSAMSRNVQALLSSPGRLQLSLEESSFDAWIRLYRPDENTRNSSQNYYGNGAVAAMCLDLLVRRATEGQRSLDDVLRHLYRSTFEEGRGYTTEDAEASLAEIGGEALVPELRRMVREALEPKLEELLVDVGVSVRRLDEEKPLLGVAFRQGSTEIASVTQHGAAYVAGLAPGDEVLALNGLRVTATNWQALFGAVARPEEPLEVLVARRGVVRTMTAVPSRGLGTVRLALDEAPSESQLAARKAWLQGRD